MKMRLNITELDLKLRHEAYDLLICMRASRKLTQVEVSDPLNRDKRTIERLEGHHSGSWNTIIGLYRAYQEYQFSQEDAFAFLQIISWQYGSDLHGAVMANVNG